MFISDIICKPSKLLIIFNYLQKIIWKHKHICKKNHIKQKRKGGNILLLTKLKEEIQTLNIFRNVMLLQNSSTFITKINAILKLDDIYCIRPVRQAIPQFILVAAASPLSCSLETPSACPRENSPADPKPA